MTDPDARDQRVETIIDERTGTGRAVVRNAAFGEGNADLGPRRGEARLGAVGQWFDDEPPRVQVRVNVDDLNVQVQLTPEQARRFSADLRTAATHALQSDAELTSGERDE